MQDAASLLIARGSMHTCVIGTIVFTVQSHGRSAYKYDTRIMKQDDNGTQSTQQPNNLKRKATQQLSPPSPRTVREGNKRVRMA